MSSFFSSFGDKTVIVNFQYRECYEEILGVWLVCFPICFRETVFSEFRTLFSVESVCSIGFMNEIISTISKKKKITKNLSNYTCHISIYQIMK